MCGICGFVGPPEGALDLEGARAMRDVITHRGPDGAGEREIAAPGLQGWLGHRRLKIIDLTDAAGQPMASEDGKVALTYNGEIYNFRALRETLEARGHRFHSTGDTEVVLRSYLEWGEDFVDHVDGMFAAALWDERSGRLLLARDRTGKKPLFYTLQRGRLSFGSEIKSLLAAPWVEAQFDVDRLPEYLTYGYVPNPGTFLKGIHQVPPASVVAFDRDGLKPPRSYWDPLDARDRRDPRPPRTALPQLLREATVRRMVSDVPLGALLSGGVDSSLIVALMTEASPDPIHTFSIGFPEEPSFDERGYAKQVADHFGTLHTEFAVKADAVALLDTLLWHHDGPFADSSAIPTYLVSQLAREHVTVVLNGDGGDEVFGGYDRFVAAKVSGLLPTGAAPLARRAAGLLPTNTGYYSLRRRAERFLELAELPVEQRYLSWVGVMNREVLGDVLADGSASLDHVDDTMEACYARAEGLPALDRILYANFKTYLPDDLAVKMDRMSMAHSLEARSPFLDTALIEYMAGVAARRKVGVRRVKPMLRQAFWDLLPAEIWNRKKHGFGVPMGRWFREDLRALFEDEALATDARTHDMLDQDSLRRLWDEHQGGTREHGFRFWTILTLERWLRGLEGARVPAVAAPVPVLDATVAD